MGQLDIGTIRMMITSKMQDKGLLTGELVHLLSFPVIHIREEQLYIAIFLYSQDNSDRKEKRYRRPSQWILSNIKTGEIKFWFRCEETDFSNRKRNNYCPYDDVAELNIDRDSKEYEQYNSSKLRRIDELFDVIRSIYNSESIFPIDKYSEYYRTVLANSDDSFQPFYDELSNIAFSPNSNGSPRTKREEQEEKLALEEKRREEERAFEEQKARLLSELDDLDMKIKDLKQKRIDDQESIRRTERTISDTLNNIELVKRQIDSAQLEKIRLERALDEDAVYIASKIETIKNSLKKEYHNILGLSVLHELKGLNQDVNNVLEEIQSSFQKFRKLSELAARVRNLVDYENSNSYQIFLSQEILRRIAFVYAHIGYSTNMIDNIRMSSIKKVNEDYSIFWLKHTIDYLLSDKYTQTDLLEYLKQQGLFSDYKKPLYFCLLSSLSLKRLELAKTVYKLLLEKLDIDENNDWELLLRLYTCGYFGDAYEFKLSVDEQFKRMYTELNDISVGHYKKVSQNYYNLISTYPNVSKKEYPLLKKYCNEYTEIVSLLANAEVVKSIAKDYENLLVTQTEHSDLDYQIEQSLINMIYDYDEKELEARAKKRRCELELVSGKKRKIIPQISEDRGEEKEKKGLEAILLYYLFCEVNTTYDVFMKRFSIGIMKSSILQFFNKFMEKNKAKEQFKYRIRLEGGFELELDEHSKESIDGLVEQHYERKSKLFYARKDKVLMGSFLTILLSVFISGYFAINHFYFSLAASLITGAISGLMIKNRIRGLEGSMEEEKEHSKFILKEVVEELSDWRSSLEKAVNEGWNEIVSAIEKY